MSDDVVELLKTVQAPPMSVDPYAAMAAGRRASVRRRRFVTVAATTAAVVLAASSVLVTARDRTLPARPTPSSPTPSTATRSLTAQLDLPGVGLLTANVDPAATTITVGRSGDRPGSPTLAVPVPTSPGRASCRVSPALLVQTCAVRAPVRAGIIAYTDPTTPDVTPSPPVVGRFSLPDVSVVVVTASATDLPSLRGAAWTLDDGTVADSFGAPVPQAHARTVPVSVFASSQDGSLVIGLRPDSFDTWGASGPDHTGITHPGLGDTTGDYYAYGLPPAAATGRVRAPSSASVSGQEVLILGGRKVLVARITGMKRFARPTAEWADKHGRVHPLP